MDSVVNINNVNNVNSVDNFNNVLIHWAKSRNIPNCHSSVSPIERLNIVITIKDWQGLLANQCISVPAMKTKIQNSKTKIQMSPVAMKSKLRKSYGVSFMKTDVAKVPEKFHKLPICHNKAIWKG